MRKFLMGMVLLLGVIFLFTRLTEVQAIGQTVRNGHWYYLSLALILEILWIGNVATTYWFIYRKLGIREKIDTLLLASSGAYFANVVAPTAGASGMAVLLSTAQRRGYSTGRTTIAGLLYLMLDYTGFILILGVGLFVLFRRDTLAIPEIIASGVLVLFALVLAGLLLIGLHSESALTNILSRMVTIINRLLNPVLKRKLLNEERTRIFAHDVAGGLHAMKQNPSQLTIPAILSILNKSILIAILLLIFLAFNIPVTIGTLIATFSIGYLFLIVSPTPAGIGTVEGALTLTLSSMYIPMGSAVVITLAYRGITFWVPLAFGGIALRMLEHRY
jgi:uncharacterized protein (TIRG00374 family)